MIESEHRVIVLLRRKSGLSRNDFDRYWGDRHGPLVAAQPEFWTYTARYCQNALIEPGDDPFDGIAISTQVDDPHPGPGFPGEPCYLAVIRPDEKKFLDFSAIVRLRAEADVLLDGAAAAAKLIALAEAPLPAEGLALPLLKGVTRLVVSRVGDISRAQMNGMAIGKVATVIEMWGGDVMALHKGLFALLPSKPVWAGRVIEREIARPA
jgi:hypothetical protein